MSTSAAVPSQPSPAVVVPAAAVGTLQALAGLLAGAAAVALVLAGALVASGAHSISFGSAGAAALSLGFACASTATIVGLARGLRPPTVALVFAIATAWTATALPLWFGVPAALLTGLVLAADHARTGPAIRGRVPVAALAAGAALLLILAAVTAEPHATPRPAAAPARPHVAKAPSAGKHVAKAPSAPAHHAAPTATPSPGAEGTAPADGATPAARPDPAAFVRAYYTALDQHRFADAWKVLSPPVKGRFGGFAHWRAGYKTTLESRPRDVRVERAANGSATVRHTLVARDTTACETPLERSFAVTWTLVPGPSGWTVASLTATASGEASPLDPCP